MSETPQSLPRLLSDAIDDIALGAILKHRQTGLIAVFVDCSEGRGVPMIASRAEEIENTDDWFVLTYGSDDYNDGDGYWLDEERERKQKKKRKGK